MSKRPGIPKVLASGSTAPFLSTVDWSDKLVVAPCPMFVCNLLITMASIKALILVQGSTCVALIQNTAEMAQLQ